LAVEEVSGETTIAIVDDDRNDFAPDEKVMDCLFERVLDCHPKFLPPVKKVDDAMLLPSISLPFTALGQTVIPSPLPTASESPFNTAIVSESNN